MPQIAGKSTASRADLKVGPYSLKVGPYGTEGRPLLKVGPYPPLSGSAVEVALQLHLIVMEVELTMGAQLERKRRKREERMYRESEIDSDLHKGAVEAPDGNFNHNAPALDADGLPNDEVAIAEDVLGANQDQTSG